MATEALAHGDIHLDLDRRQPSGRLGDHGGLVRLDGSPTLAAFIASPGNDYVVNSTNFLTINNIGAGGTASPDIANSLTVSDPQASLRFADPGGALDVTNALSLAGLVNLGTAFGGSVLSMGSAGAGGLTINLASSGRLEGALGDSVENLGTHRLRSSAPAPFSPRAASSISAPAFRSPRQVPST